MNPLILRDEQPPDDTVVVVRGGEMNSEPVKLSAQDLELAFDQAIPRPIVSGGGYDEFRGLGSLDRFSAGRR